MNLQLRHIRAGKVLVKESPQPMLDLGQGVRGMIAKAQPDTGISAILAGDIPFNFPGCRASEIEVPKISRQARIARNSEILRKVIMKGAVEWFDDVCGKRRVSKDPGIAMHLASQIGFKPEYVGIEYVSGTWKSARAFKHNPTLVEREICGYRLQISIDFGAPFIQRRSKRRITYLRKRSRTHSENHESHRAPDKDPANWPFAYRQVHQPLSACP